MIPGFSNLEAHRDWRYRGPKQGAECRCGGMFYPASGSHADQVAAWGEHVRRVTGLLPAELRRNETDKDPS